MALYDIFISTIKGSNNIANHAIGMYINWIFVSNKNISIPLCKEGLDYCVSPKDTEH